VLWSRFSTYYLALFPVGVILSWFFVNLWPVSRLIAVAPPLVSVSLAGLDFLLFCSNLGHDRPSSLGLLVLPQKAKYCSHEFAEHLDALPYSYQPGSGSGVYMSLTVLVGLTLVHLLRHWQEINRGLWILLLGLASAPSLGVTILDFVFDKHLHQSALLSTRRTRSHGDCYLWNHTSPDFQATSWHIIISDFFKPADAHY